MVLYPAVCAKLALRGLGRLGRDPVAIKRAARIEGVDLDAPDATVSRAAMRTIWTEAPRRARREELPTEAGLAVPLGALGVVDYLAGSAKTVEDAIRVAVTTSARSRRRSSSSSSPTRRGHGSTW